MSVVVEMINVAMPKQKMRYCVAQLRIDKLWSCVHFGIKIVCGFCTIAYGQVTVYYTYWQASSWYSIN